MTGRASTIVAGVDGSDTSADALALALLLSGSLEARLLPVFVHPYGALSGTLPESEYERFLSELADSVHAQMRELEIPAAERRLRILTDRSPAAGLQRAAGDEGAELIVVGGSRRSRVGRVFPGGTAERLLAGGPCPLAVAPRGYAGEPPELGFVGCGFDGSREAREALEWAAGLASSADAQLRILSVHQHLPAVNMPAGAGLPLASVDEEVRAGLARRLGDAESELRARDLRVTGALLDGDPVSCLTDASAHLDLLVLGSRGYGPLGAVLLGSVSNALVRESDCPVIVVPRPQNP